MENIQYTVLSGDQIFIMKNPVLDLLIQYKAVEFGDFVLASGAKSKYYIDVKTAVMQPELLSAIADTVAETFAFDVAAGVAVGGVPLAVGVSLRSGKPCAVIRAAAKEHGKSGMIIGDVAGKRVLLIEDVTTSGGSSLHGISEIRAAGGIIEDVVTVVDRGSGAAELLRNAGVTLHPLVRAGELFSG
jgi:orotate phosphoribosyltransferase